MFVSEIRCFRNPPFFLGFLGRTRLDGGVCYRSGAVLLNMRRFWVITTLFSDPSQFSADRFLFSRKLILGPEPISFRPIYVQRPQQLDQQQWCALGERCLPASCACRYCTRKKLNPISTTRVLSWCFVGIRWWFSNLPCIISNGATIALLSLCNLASYSICCYYDGINVYYYTIQTQKRSAIVSYPMSLVIRTKLE